MSFTGNVSEISALKVLISLLCLHSFVKVCCYCYQHHVCLFSAYRNENVYPHCLYFAPHASTLAGPSSQDGA